MKKIPSFLISLGVLLMLPFVVYSQKTPEIGLPFIVNYTPRQYQSDAQIWSVIQDEKGMMHFGTNSGILEYDGVKWNKVKISNTFQSSVRAMEKDSSGRIYYGIPGDFGYLGVDSIGQTVGISLLDLVGPNDRDFLDIRSIQVSDEAIYFQSREAIFRVNTPVGPNSKVTVWKPETSFMYAFYLDGIYYIHEAEKGLFNLVNDIPQLIPGSEFLGNDRVQIMLPYPSEPNEEKKYIIATFESGFYIFDGTTFQPFQTEIDLSKSGFIYKGIALENGLFVLGCVSDGLYLIDKDGKVIEHHNQKVGLQNNAIYALHIDNKGVLWMGLDNGISRLELNSPFTKYTIESGLTDQIISITRYKGSLYVGTSNGILRLNQDSKKFELVPGSPLSQIFGLTDDGNQLLIGTQSLFALQNEQVVPILGSTSLNFSFSGLFITQTYPNILFGTQPDGVAIFTRKNAEAPWELEGKIDGLLGTFSKILQNKDGTIWAIASNEAFLISLGKDSEGKLDMSKTSYQRFGPEEGYPISGNAFNIKGINYIQADSILYAFNEQEKKLIPDTVFGKFSRDPLKIFDINADYNGNIWIATDTQIKHGILSADGGYKFEESRASLFGDLLIGANITNYPEPDSIIWFVTSDGLVRYDEKLDNKKVVPYHTYIRHILAGSSRLNILQDITEDPLAIEFSSNSLRFEYAAPFFEREDKTRYQTWLEGFEKNWSEFDNNNYKEFTNLPPGTYTFHAKAINIFGQESEEALFKFEISSPWYRTWWAYLLYVLLASGLVVAFSKWRLQQLRTKHELLENTVAERTKELSQRVSELAVLNTIQDGLVKEVHSDGIYELVGEKLRHLFDTQSVIIRAFDLKNDQEHWKYSIERGERQYTDPRPINWANKQLIETKAPLVINKDYVATAQKYGGKGVSIGIAPKSAVFVPIMVGDKIKGSVSLQNLDKESAFSDAEVKLLSTITNSMGVALENTRLFDETNRLLEESTQKANELLVVNRVTKALASYVSLDEIIHLVGDQMKELFQANIVYLALLDKKSNTINFPYQFGDDMPPQRFGDGLTSKILNTGKPLLINKDVEEMTTKLGSKRLGIPSASYLGVPIFQGEEAIGVLSVQSTESENRFDESDSNLLSTIASSVGVAINKAQLFEEVVASKKAAEQANEAKSAFLSTVSHELRTPLTSVLGFAKIIQKRLEEKIFPLVDKTEPKTERTLNQVSENLNVVISEGERLTSLINDVLDLAKIEAGKMNWNQEEVALPEVVERAIASTNSLFAHKNLKLIREIEGNIPSIIGDSNKLIQVVINLISNAVKFTDEGSVTCSIRQEGNEIITSVKDTGMGIAPGDFGAVFEQFKQIGGDTLTDKPKGTGLGLPICKEIVEHHGGRIWLESEVGKGSTFSFAIPFTKKESSSFAAPIHLNELVNQLKQRMVFSKLKSVANAQILIVDDDESIRSLLRQELTEAGYLTSEVSNGKEAIESIRENRPDLIILDIMMPEINGFDVAAILKNDPQTMDIPIIILSIVQDKARGFRIGVDRYLTKPIDTAQLFEDIGALLEQGKSKRKVMVVDEDSAAIRTLTDVLQTKGYHVVESDGKEMVEKAKETLPDIIILNSMLSANDEIVQTLRFEKGLENVLFFIYQ